MYIPRYTEKLVKDLNKGFKVLYIGGARQVGKTTLLQHVAGKNRQVVSLDSLERRSQAQRDPQLFLQQYSVPILIDEVQYAPDLLFRT